MRNIHILLEQVKTSLPVCLRQEIAKFVTTSKYVVKIVVTKTYNSIVLDSTSIIYTSYICPQASTQTHVTRFTGRIDVASAQVMRAQPAASITDGFNLPVRRGVMMP